MESFTNIEYLYQHLPARMRRDDGGAASPLDYLDDGGFGALIGSVFTVFATDDIVELTLTAVIKDPNGADTFSLQFSGPSGAIQSGTYTVRHNLLGGLTLFVSPIDFPSLGHYEIVFDRLAAPPLPAFLRRFLLFFCSTLDLWDFQHEDFYRRINPDTAPEKFINFWLWALFDWSWFPQWFTLARKRRLYADFTQHLARRGTALGIERFLQAFSIFARVYNRPQYWGEFAFAAIDEWTITDALGVVVQIDHLADEVNLDRDGQAFGEFAWGRDYFADTRPTLTRKEIEDLCRFEWPESQRMMIDYRVLPEKPGPAVEFISALGAGDGAEIVTADGFGLGIK